MLFRGFSVKKSSSLDGIFMNILRYFWCLQFFLIFLVSCQSNDQEPLSIEQVGQRVYEAQCSSCHHQNPTKDHVLGPAVVGSSLELLEARILRGEYPESYQPKRPTRMMLKMPALQSKIEAIHAYLNSSQHEVQGGP